MNRKQFYILLAGLSLAGYAWFGWNIVEDSATPTACMFKAVTHLPCPSCGTTRSLVMLMHGDLWASLLINPFGVVLALVLMVVPVWLVADILLKRDTLFQWYGAAERKLSENKWLSVPAIAIVIVNWIWNISKGL